jgi:hypothetical protein
LTLLSTDVPRGGSGVKAQRTVIGVDGPVRAVIELRDDARAAAAALAAASK